MLDYELCKYISAMEKVKIYLRLSWITAGSGLAVWLTLYHSEVIQRLYQTCLFAGFGTIVILILKLDRPITYGRRRHRGPVPKMTPHRGLCGWESHPADTRWNGEWPSGRHFG